MSNKHEAYDLKQMQSLPLEAKIIMTKQRITTWYESWKRYEIYNKKTEKTRFVTATEEPPLKEDEYIETATSGWVYVSFSGGKDSTVLKHIVDSMYSDVPALFVNTGLEYPEIQNFVREIKSGKYDCFNSDVEMVRPEMRFDEVLKTYGYPVISKEVSKKLHDANTAKISGYENSYAIRQFNGTYLTKNGKKSQYNVEKYKFLLDAPFNTSHKCCDVMKKKPSKSYEKETGRIPFIGTMAAESRLRYSTWLKHGCNAFEKDRPTSQPLSFWTEQDILQYIKKYTVPYCPVYGDIVIDLDTYEIEYVEQVDSIDYLGKYFPEDKLKTTGCSRTGCMFCMFGCHLEKEPNRFQRLQETHPRQYEYCIGGGEFIWEGTYKNSITGKNQKISWINDDGTAMTNEQIEEFIEKYKDSGLFTFKKVWQPNKEGLGLGKVLDFINVDYE